MKQVNRVVDTLISTQRLPRVVVVTVIVAWKQARQAIALL